ncbi:MAG: hypothetical protein R2747_21405 [Pyrinomonadaceae bacterium]
MGFLDQNYRKQLAAGALALLAAVPIAFAVYYVNFIWSEDPEKAVKIVGVLFGVLGFVPPFLYLLIRGRSAKLGELGLIMIATVAVLSVACYLFQAGFYVMFRGDFIIWSESDFVNDILKFRQGYPLFTAQANNESFIYPPGSQLLTYLISWLTGGANSIPAYRIIQVGYTALAAVVAFLCCRRLVKNVSPEDSNILGRWYWGVIWLVGLFLMATNSLSNPFVHLLHNDSLAQLLTVTAFWLLLEYEASEDKRILWVMVLLPAVGFWVKQSLIIWAGLYLLYLITFIRPRSIARIIGFGTASFGAVLVSIGIGYLLWQGDFIYWVFTVLRAHGVSPLRSFKHLLDIWEYFAVGLVGGLVLLQLTGLKKLLGPWLVWLILISTETYTSGVAWMLNHIGPGCLIAGIWFWAAFAILWSRYFNAELKTADLNEWLKLAVGTAVICLLFSGLGIIRVPVRPFDFQDSQRYVEEIENEFAGEEPESVLLDTGTWIYLKDGVIQKDRASTFGDRGYAQIGDFSGFSDRLKQKHYKKILVRNYHSPDFWYDHELWSKSSQIRQTLMENYQEIGTIKAVNGLKPEELPYGFSEISILVPRTN